MPPEVQQAIIQYLMSMGMDPGGIMTSYGMAAADPDVLDQQRDATNYMQDRSQMLMDPLSGVMAGAGGFDYAAFEPTVTMEQVDRPGERQLAYYQGRSEGTLERMIADHIAAGGTAASAFAEINSVLTSTDPQFEQAKSVLLASIPPVMDYATGVSTGQPDLKWVMDQAKGLEEAIATDPIGNYQDENGQWFNRTEEDSDLMKQWKAAGLPDPRQEYTIDQAMGSDWSAVRGMMQNDGSQQAIMDARERAMKPASAMVDNPNIDLGKSLYDQPVMRPDGGVDRRTVSWAGNPDVSWRTNPETAARGPLAVGIDALPQPNLTPDQVQQIRVRTPQQNATVVDPSGQRNKDAALAQLRKLIGDREEMRGTMFGQDYWTNLGATTAARAQGRTPALDAIMARRMQQYATGIPSPMGY